MGTKWNNSLAGVTAVFPGGIFPGVVVRNQDLNGYEVTGEVLGTAVWTEAAAGVWRAYLNYVPLEQSTFEAVDQSDMQALRAIPWGETPAADEVAVSLETGAVQVHASRATHNVSFSYRGRGTDVVSRVLNPIQAELIATQTELADAVEELEDLGTAVGAIDTRLGTAEGDIDTLQTDVTALDGRVDTAETDISALEGYVSGAATRNARVLYLSEGGSDSTGDGSVGKPLRSINAAVALINAGATNSRWDVRMGPGQFDLYVEGELPAIEADKRICWIGAGAALTELTVVQPDEGDPVELFPVAAPVIYFAHMAGLKVTQAVMTVADLGAGYVWTEGYAVLRSASGNEAASIVGCELVGTAGVEDATMRVQTDGVVTDCDLSLVTVTDAAGSGRALAVRDCVCAAVVSLNADTVANVRGGNDATCLDAWGWNGATLIAERARNCVVTGGNLTAAVVEGCLVTDGQLVQRVDANNRWTVTNTRLVRLSGSNREMVLFLTGNTLKTSFFNGLTVLNKMTFAEAPTGGVSIFFVVEGRHDLYLEGCEIDSTIIPFMISHTGLDPDRTQAKNVYVRGGNITFLRAATAGPADRNSIFCMSNRGELIVERCTLRSLLAASTNATNDHAPISWQSSTGAGAGTAILRVRDCIIETTLPDGAVTGGKASIASLLTAGTPTIDAEFDGITLIEDANADFTFQGVGGSALRVGVVVSGAPVSFEDAPEAAQQHVYIGSEYPVLRNPAAFRNALRVERSVACPVVSWACDSVDPGSGGYLCDGTLGTSESFMLLVPLEAGEVVTALIGSFLDLDLGSEASLYVELRRKEWAESSWTTVGYVTFSAGAGGTTALGSPHAISADHEYSIYASMTRGASTSAAFYGAGVVVSGA